MRGEKHVPTIPTSARRLDLYRVNLELISVCQPLCARLRGCAVFTSAPHFGLHHQERHLPMCALPPSHARWL